MEQVELKDPSIHVGSTADFLAKMNVSIESGLTREEAKRHRSLHGLNTIRPPVNCPSWVCCLLPCLLRTPSMRAFHTCLPQEGTVLRNGRKYRMDSTSIVYGDVIHLKPQDRIVADMRLVECSDDLQVCVRFKKV